MHHVISFPRDTIYLDVCALGQYFHWPEGCTYFLQESFSLYPLLMGESLKILQVAEGYFFNFVHAKAYHHLLDVGDSVFSFFSVFFFSYLLLSFFHSVHYAMLGLESWLRPRRESLFGLRGTFTCHVSRFLAIEALAFFSESASLLGCKCLEVSANGISLYFCYINIYWDVLRFPFLTWKGLDGVVVAWSEDLIFSLMKVACSCFFDAYSFVSFVPDGTGSWLISILALIRSEFSWFLDLL